MTHYSIEPKTRKYVKGYAYLSFARNLSNKYGKQLLDTAAINVSKKVTHEAVKTTGAFLGNKIADALAKLYDDRIVKTKHVID